MFYSAHKFYASRTNDEIWIGRNRNLSPMTDQNSAFFLILHSGLGVQDGNFKVFCIIFAVSIIAKGVAIFHLISRSYPHYIFYKAICLTVTLCVLNILHKELYTSTNLHTPDYLVFSN